MSKKLTITHRENDVYDIYIDNVWVAEAKGIVYASALAEQFL